MRELEIAGLGAVDGLVGPKAAAPGDGPKHADAHTECLNCGASLMGKYCYACGQTSDDHHRSIFHLIWEAVEGLTHLDGRLARTLPPLFLNPGRLARDHFEGRRQRHVPPFRLFLISLLIFMFSLETRTHHGAPELRKQAEATFEAENAKMGGDAAPAVTHPANGVTVTRSQTDTTVKYGGGLVAVGTGPGDGASNPADALSKVDNSKIGKTPFGRWMVEHGRKANASRELFRATIFEWAHRLAIVLLPIFAGMLALVYCYRRKFYIYDHLVVSMHFLSFVFLIWAVAYLIPSPIGGFVMLAFAVWTPVNLFMTLRGAYGSSIAGALVKTAALWIATLILFVMLLLGVIFVALGSL